MISTDLQKWIKDDHRDILIKPYTYKCILCSLTGGLETLSVSHCAPWVVVISPVPLVVPTVPSPQFPPKYQP